MSKYTESEVVKALKEIGPTKALDMDSFPALLFQYCWHIFGSDVSKFCLGVLNEGWSIEPINVPNIVLLLKIPHPSNMANFKPISLCNVVYKVIAKMMVNQFRTIMDKCIDAT